MHPAPSIIVFTVLSGLGFGYLFWLGLMPAKSTHFAQYVIAFVFAGAGLVASTFHLGNPQRALRAFTQWRTSWLSREAVLAVAAFGCMGLTALGVLAGVSLQPLGFIGAVLSLATVIATSMIYGQLQTVPRWNQWTTPVLFVLLSLTGGAIFTQGSAIVAVFLIFSGLVMMLHWSVGDTRLKASGSTMNTATGLHHGTVRAFEPPHTGNNYLLHEMVFVVARNHAIKLRVIAFGLAFVLPVLLIMLLGGGPVLVAVFVLHLAGVFVSRWLFFAEAEHVVGLYYGKR